MKPFYSHLARTLLLATALLLGTGARATWAASAPIYSNTGNDGARVTRTCTTFLGLTTCFGEITNPELATDNDFNSAAVMNVPASALAGSVRLRMNLATTAPANYRAGVLVERSGTILNLLSLNTANLIVVRTYLRNGTTSTLQEERAVDASVASTLLGSNTGKIRLEFLASKSFNQIEVEAASALSLGYDLKVYYAYAIDANVITSAKGYASRFENAGTTNYSTGVVKNGITVCVNSNVTNPLNAVDKSLTNFATMKSVADLSCPSTLQTQLEGTAPAGYQAGFVLGSGSLLDATVLDGLRVTTYLGGVPQESATGANLLNLEVLGNQQYNVSFPTTKPYDRVEIQQTKLLSVLDDLRVFYGFGLEPRVFRDLQPRISEFVEPAGNYQVNGSVVCVNCSVQNPQNAADRDKTTNYATVRTALSVGGTTRLKLRLDGPGLAGNVAGAVLGLGTGLLDANLLSNIRINTYTGSHSATGSGTTGAELVESAVGSSLLSVEVLADGRQEVSFRTTRDFDWVEIELTNGVALLDNTQVYYGFAEDRPMGFPSSITAPAPLPVQLVGFSARATGSTVNLVWQTASELNSKLFLVERSLRATADFEPIGQVEAAGTSTTTRQYTLRDAEAGAQQVPMLYYRLRQVDLDGKETYSAVVPVSLKTASLAFAVYPNPASAADNIQATVPALPEGNYQLFIYNMQGGLVSQQKVTGQLLEISALHLRAGLYQLVLGDATGQRLATQRLVIRGQ
ncbi:T9SS type A sorting domain-containing protein [Hymenobacter sublimis]|uniref:T9SS type A sorting domain-containing protein n=1 Tax=Hymenobacter sublimis TaxID=2933777 RepID=A0ABY4J7E1_9BACT|nr:T9SS type A sorting domain-containing protein [Hymenobacter sublimis]UPL48718.1 T9SS type A sorting domain-containing protein [Hymenobacter sublimis]